MSKIAPLVCLLFASTYWTACGGSDKPAEPPASGPTAGPTPEAGAPQAAQPARRESNRDAIVVDVSDPDDDRPVQPDVAEARALIDSGATPEARAILDKAIAARPEDADAWYWRGRAWGNEERRDEAIADLEEATRLAPDFANAHRQAAFHYVWTKHCDLAMPHLERVIELRPNDSAAWFNRGHCRFYGGDKDGSLADGKKACEMGFPPACKVMDRVQRITKFREMKSEKEAAEKAAAEQAGTPPPGTTPPGTAPTTPTVSTPSPETSPPAAPPTGAPEPTR